MYTWYTRSLGFLLFSGNSQAEKQPISVLAQRRTNCKQKSCSWYTHATTWIVWQQLFNGGGRSHPGEGGTPVASPSHVPSPPHVCVHTPPDQRSCPVQAPSGELPSPHRHRRPPPQTCPHASGSCLVAALAAHLAANSAAAWGWPMRRHLDISLAHILSLEGSFLPDHLVTSLFTQHMI
mgnify:CR=1 FL=1